MTISTKASTTIDYDPKADLVDTSITRTPLSALTELFGLEAAAELVNAALGLGTSPEHIAKTGTWESLFSAHGVDPESDLGLSGWQPPEQGLSTGHGQQDVMQESGNTAEDKNNGIDLGLEGENTTGKVIMQGGNGDGTGSTTTHDQKTGEQEEIEFWDYTSEDDIGVDIPVEASNDEEDDEEKTDEPESSEGAPNTSPIEGDDGGTPDPDFDFGRPSDGTTQPGADEGTEAGGIHPGLAPDHGWSDLTQPGADQQISTANPALLVVSVDHLVQPPEDTDVFG